MAYRIPTQYRIICIFSLFAASTNCDLEIYKSGNLVERPLKRADSLFALFWLGDLLWVNEENRNHLPRCKLLCKFSK